MSVEEGGPVVAAVTGYAVADEHRRMRVRANADNGPDAARARRFGAAASVCAAPSTCSSVSDASWSSGSSSPRPTRSDRRLRRAAAAAASRLRRALRSDGRLPVIVRLLDPPLHEFLPRLLELSVKVAAGSLGRHDRESLQLLAEHRLHEDNPMLGMRGVRLGRDPRPIRDAGRGRWSRPRRSSPSGRLAARDHGAARRRRRGAAQHPGRDRQRGPPGAREDSVHLEHLVGTMIELPRAALTAGAIAEAADFFSFGTNDLTQTTWGFSRDDVESSFFSRYMEAGILGCRRSRPSTARESGASSESAPTRAAGQARAQGRGVRRARGRPGVGALLRRSGGWTTCRARHSGCRWRGSRRGGPSSTACPGPDQGFGLMDRGRKATTARPPSPHAPA